MDNIDANRKNYLLFKEGKLSLQEIKDLYKKASEMYDLGEQFMTDKEFDEFEENIRREYQFDEDEDFTNNVDIELNNNLSLKDSEIILEIPMPSFDKPSEQKGLNLWLDKMKNSETFLVMAKLDGVSAQWNSDKKNLSGKTRKASIGTNLNIYINHLKGLKNLPGMIVRGEIMADKKSEAAKNSSDPRNGVAGIMNPRGKNKDESIRRSEELQFVAYEIIEPKNISPIEQIKILQESGFVTPFYKILNRENLTAENLTEIYNLIETSSETNHYNYDGVVVYPDLKRDKNYIYEKTSTGGHKNLKDRIGWKVKKDKKIYERIVSEVIWSVNERKILTPICIFEPEIIYQTEGSDKCKRYSKVSLHNAFYIKNDGIGEGAKIKISIAGDCIPKYEGVVEKTEPSFPNIEYEWQDSVRIIAIEETTKSKIDKLQKSLDALGVDGIGPKLVEKFYCNGFETLEKIFSAKPSDFLSLDRVGAKSSENIFKGLRHNKNSWTIIDFMEASRVFPAGISRSKLGFVLSISEDWKNWNFEEMKDKVPKGLTLPTLKLILGCMDDFEKFYNSFSQVVGEVKSINQTQETERNLKPSGKVLVFTGTTAKTLGIEDKLLSLGHIIDENVTKKTTHLVFSGTLKETTKTKKANEYKIPIINVIELFKN